MSEQNTLFRTLEMLIILSKPGGVSTKNLAKQYNCSIRTIQRTIDTIRDAGFIVGESKGKYKIDKLKTKESKIFDIGDLLHFSKEEAELLNRSIQSIPGRNAIKENLTKKLYSLYGSENVANNLVRQEDSEQVRIIIDAVQNGYQIKVSEYSYSTANRGLHEVVIEPIEFAFDYSRVWAYYPRQRKNFLLRLSGINGVKALNEPYKHAVYHKVGYTDIFRGYGFSKMPLNMELNTRAFGFLIEEYPLAAKYVKRTDLRVFILETEVCDLFQVARFYLGLPGDIKVIEPANFSEYITNMNMRWSESSYERRIPSAVSESQGEIVPAK